MSLGKGGLYEREGERGAPPIKKRYSTSIWLI